jgi:hypothetical protein
VPHRRGPGVVAEVRRQHPAAVVVAEVHPLHLPREVGYGVTRGECEHIACTNREIEMNLGAVLKPGASLYTWERLSLNTF